MTQFLALLKRPGVILSALAVLGLSIALWVQTGRLGSAQATVTAQGETIGVLRHRVNDDAKAIAQRDQLIGTQNEAVKAIAQVDRSNQAAYQARIAAADRTALAHSTAAQSILSAQAGTEDELGRCRAALHLIVDTVRPRS